MMIVSTSSAYTLRHVWFFADFSPAFELAEHLFPPARTVAIVNAATKLAPTAQRV
jgi:hypothetical protein